MKFWKELFWR